MDKYYKEEKKEKTSRTIKNQNIYTEIDDDDYENLNLTSNISILNSDTDNLNIDEIKRLVNEKYQKPSREIDLEDFEDSEEDDNEDTKEYDLKKIIEEAHKNKTPDYDKERFKKLRETQYEILNSLNVNRTGEPELEETLTPDEATLMNLIKTVNENALRNKTMKFNSEDLMGDLLSGDKTETIEALSFDNDNDIEPDKKTSLVEELEKTKQLSRQEIEDEMSKFTTKLDDVINTLQEMTEEDIEEDYTDEYTKENTLTKEENLTNSFYTGNYQILDKDMDDEFDDLEGEINGGNIVIKMLILLLVVIVLAIIVYLLNKYLNLGLF